LLNELCDAVIGYEGGICHLAHILEVPSFILPWHHHITSWVAFEDWKIEMQMHHLDKKTYFLNSIDELLNFSTDDFIDKIQSLKNNNGNNFILSNEVAINESFSHIKIADKIYSLLGAFSGEEKDFFTNFKTPLMVGGVNPLGRLVL
jgi:hypothetical protein